jgi:hypothetical protein
VEENMKKFNFQASFTVLFVLIFVLNLIFFTVSCSPELSFGELSACADMDQQTYESSGSAEEFDAGEDKIYVTMEYCGVRGDDNYRYNWVYLDTGETILDETGKYSEGESGYLEGYVMSYISTNDEINLLKPGDYKAEFYHNGEMKDTVNFKINKPAVKISEAALANEVDENYAPVNTTQQFLSTETVYACVKVNYYFTGNSLKAKWFDGNGNLIIETDSDFDVDLYEPVWTAFSFEGEGRDIMPGPYKVEIYLNDNLHDTYDFEVGDARSAEKGEDIFTQGNKYSNDKYNASFSVPDEWVYTETDDADGLEVKLMPESSDLAINFLFMASPADDYPPASQYKNFAEEIVANAANEQGWEFIELQENEQVTNKGIKYKDFIYLYRDSDNTEWAMVVSFTEGENRLYVIFGIVMDSCFKLGESVYLGIMESLEL